MPDYIFMLQSRLAPAQNSVVARLQQLAQQHGLNIYLTGGAVRDLIAGLSIRDLDFTVEGNPQPMLRELEKEGTRVLEADTRLHHYELLFPDDFEGSLAAARDELYAVPGGRPDIRWSTIMEDLRRRDFSINAIALSLNPASRGLLLDPSNGVADIERREIRALTIHCFTNQPVRLLRILRYGARLGYRMETRTEEWFELALERGLHRQIPPSDIGRELKQLAREDNPVAVLKRWDEHDLLTVIHPQFQRKRPDYEGLTRLQRVVSTLVAAGVRPRLQVPVLHYVFARFGPRELAAALRRYEFRAEEVAAVLRLPAQARQAAQTLKSKALEAPRAAFDFLDRLPRELLAFLLAEQPHPKVAARIRSYLSRWRPLHRSLPVAELEALGVPHGPTFDLILDRLFDRLLAGKGRTPAERSRLLRQLVEQHYAKPGKAAERAVERAAGRQRPAERKPAARVTRSRRADQRATPPTAKLKQKHR